MSAARRSNSLLVYRRGDAGKADIQNSTASRPLLTSVHGYSFMTANAALRCQSNKAVRSSRAQDDGVVGLDL